MQNQNNAPESLQGKSAEDILESSIFVSPEWADRARTLGEGQAPFELSSLKRTIRVALWAEGAISDREDWQRVPWTSAPACDWVSVRKLSQHDVQTLNRTRPGRGFALKYSEAPFLDLRQPVVGKSEPMAHIRRCKRKCERELGHPVTLSIVQSAEDLSRWFEAYQSFQLANQHMNLRQLEQVRHWVFDAPLPSWLLPLWLKCGDTILCVGLSYEWNRVHSYFSAAMNPNPELRKYGSGKIYVDSLIQLAKDRDQWVFDFLQGEHPYKTHWNPKVRNLYQWVEPRSWRGKVAAAAWRWTRRLKKEGLHA